MPPETTISEKRYFVYIKAIQSILNRIYDRGKQRMGIPMPSRTDMFGLITSFELTRNMSPI